jgi:hypothetical protein
MRHSCSSDEDWLPLDQVRVLVGEFSAAPLRGGTAFLLSRDRSRLDAVTFGRNPWSAAPRRRSCASWPQGSAGRLRTR